MTRGCAHQSRIALITFSKMFPFGVCFIVCVSYLESAYSLCIGDMVQYEGYYVLAKPLSWAIGEYFMYDWDIVAVATLLSFATETCIWNKLCLVYIGLNLWQRSLFTTIELYVEDVVPIVLVNLLVSFVLTYKGINIICKK